MNVNPIGITPSQGPASYVSGASASFTHSPIELWSQSLSSPIGQQFMQAISRTTGLSTSDVTAQLQGGRSLHDILSSKGVTFSQVRQAVRAAGGNTAIAGRHHHHQGAGIDSASSSQFLDVLAGKLGLSATNLTQDLQSGQGLAQIASAQGLSSDQLVSAIQDTLQSMAAYNSSASIAPTNVPPAQINASA
jgi:hypothetical protein